MTDKQRAAEATSTPTAKTTAKVIDFSRFGKSRAAIVTAGVLNYVLRLDEEDAPIKFSFLYKGAGLLAAGNLIVVTGREKTGKSAFGVALVAAAMGGSFLGVQPVQANMRVLWVDTEQDRDTLRRRAKKAVEMAGLEGNSEGLEILSLRAADATERLKITLEAIEEFKPDFVFLDGAVDLCTDFNDNVECMRVVSELMACAGKCGCAILTVIHTNKGNSEARGHLGSILQQKCSEVFAMERDGKSPVATVKQVRARFHDVPDLAFEFTDDFGLQAAYGGNNALEQEKAKWDKLFAEESEYTYSDLYRAYAEQEAVGTEAAKKAVKKAVDFGWLLKEGTKRNTKYLLATVENELKNIIIPNTDEDDEL